jgi:dihydrofolate reductase
VRKVVLYHLQSLDGIAFEDGDWFTDGGPEMFANLARVIETQDDILLGRRTYDYWVGYWPTSDIEPSRASSTPPRSTSSPRPGRPRSGRARHSSAIRSAST